MPAFFGILFAVSEGFEGIDSLSEDLLKIRMASLFFVGGFIFVSAFLSSGWAKSLVFPPYLHSYGIRRATKQHLFMFFGPMASFSNPQGLAVTRMISRDDPSIETDDDEVIVYGVNADHHELIYNTSMWGLAKFGSKGNGVGEFNCPRGVAAEPGGNVFVADSGNGRVVRLFNPKKNVGWVRAYRGNEAGGKPFRGPVQIAVDQECQLFVSDPVDSRLVAFDTAGKRFRDIRPLGTAGFVDGPTTVAIADGRSRWSYFHAERALFCVDKRGTRLWKLDPVDGRILAQAAMPKGYSSTYGAVDYYHNFWVTDVNRHCIVKFDHDLQLLDVFGSYGTGDDQFVEPRGIAMYKRYGQAFIAEKEGAQYYWVGTGCTERTLTRLADGRCRLSLKLTEYSYVSVWGAVNGIDTCFYLRKNMQTPPVAQTVIGNTSTCKLKQGERITVRVEPTYSSYSYRYSDYQVAVP